MSKYAYEIISDDDFEALTVDVCQTLFGSGVHAFAKGKDGGRDSYFNGTAENYPSQNSPWSGHIIIQAKHTEDINASCADNNFFQNKTSVINHEISRIKEMMNAEKVDGYLLVTNRKLTGLIHPKIVDHISKELKFNQVDILGIEDLDRIIDDNQQLETKYRLSRYQLPDRFYEQDIRDVILMFSNNNNWVTIQPDPEIDEYTYVDKKKKNKLNNIDDEYFDEIKSHSLKFFSDISDFLKDPKNLDCLTSYTNTTSDLRSYITKHSATHSFTEILETIVSNIAGEQNTNIFNVRYLVKVFVHYMYWNCDIGRKN